MKLKVYLDTSVFSAYYDDSMPERMAETTAFWGRLRDLQPGTSEVTKAELSRTPDPARREALLELLRSVALDPVTGEMRTLARYYVDSGIFTESMLEDATHVAAAVLEQYHVVVSWNFRHLVNRQRRARINAANVSRGLPTVEIVAPPEL